MFSSKVESIITSLLAAFDNTTAGVSSLFMSNASREIIKLY